MARVSCPLMAWCLPLRRLLSRASVMVSSLRFDCGECSSSNWGFSGEVVMRAHFGSLYIVAYFFQSEDLVLRSTASFIRSVSVYFVTISESVKLVDLKRRNRSNESKLSRPSVTIRIVFYRSICPSFSCLGSFRSSV